MFNKQLKINLVFIFTTLFYVGLSPQTVHASCVSTIFYRPNLVIAKLESQELNCESNELVNNFNKIVVLKGDVEEQFQITTPIIYGECPTISKPEELYIVPVCAGCPPTPKFEKTKTYLMSLDSKTNQISTEYSLPNCDRIFSEVTGIFDPKVIFYLLKIIVHPIWLFGLMLASFLGYTHMKIFPPVISGTIGVIIVMALYGIIFYVLFRVIKFIVKLLKKKK